MSTLGLIGGMSWHSTAHYYRRLNEEVAAARGGHASAHLLLESLDFAAVREHQEREDWAGAGRLLADAGRRLESAGADAVLICTNLMHKVAGDVEAAVGVPLLHIGDAVAAAAPAGATRVGIVGARWTMTDPFYAERLARHGIDVVVPDAAERDLVDRVVFEELTRGVVRAESRTAYAGVFASLADRGADAIVLACTEIGLLVGADDSPVPLVDSMEAHATYAAAYALGALPVGGA